MDEWARRIGVADHLPFRDKRFEGFWHERGSSFLNLKSLEIMAIGRMISDVVAIIGSIDIVLGEIDR